MGKTQLTLDIEEALYFYELEKGEIAVEEVGMPGDWGIVDTLALRTQADGTHEWRCYEIKVSKSDFRSQARITFVGHYNYYVLPRPLYEQVKEEIPAFAGVILYLPFQDGYHSEVPTKGTLSLVKKASRQEIPFDERQLMHTFLHALFREVRKAKRVKKGLGHYSGQELLDELSRRKSSQSQNFYDRFVDEIEQDVIFELQEELLATKEEYEALRDKMREKNRVTEPYL